MIRGKVETAFPKRSCSAKAATSLLLGRGGAGSGTSSRRGAGRSTRSGTRRGAFGRTGSGSRGGSSRRGSGLHFFSIARRRHDRDQGNVAALYDADAFRKLDIAQVLGVIDF